MGRGITMALIAALAACSGPAPRAPTPPAWQLLHPTATTSLWTYGESIATYAPEDRGAYVVRLSGGPEERHAAATALGLSDDVIGDDGYVVRLDGDALAAMRTRPGVVAIAPLQPSDRRGILVDRGTELPEVRIELFSDASTDELEAIAAWIDWRGGQVLWRGRTAVRARLPHEARDEAGRLSAVRWVE